MYLITSCHLCQGLTPTNGNDGGGVHSNMTLAVERDVNP